INMITNKLLDRIMDKPSKVRVIRLFVSRREDFTASGREVARQLDISPTTAHTALKELYEQDVLKRDIFGKQHLYRLNKNSRAVKKILLPAFNEEFSARQDIIDFIRKKTDLYNLKNKIVSLVIYGSTQKGTASETSDVDIAVIVKNNVDKNRIEDIFTEKITGEFYEYFGAHLDPYIKKKSEFIEFRDNHKSPVSTLMKRYTVIAGKDPVDLQ
ncbi:MAG: nucleotidyltransferase domain-containing protein, partial [Elusimicrobia bacterium]|nr:nucleotidyltransferase domain-containing protein [Elusimicrobiota bacterium]